MSILVDQPAWLVAAIFCTAIMLVLIFGPLGLPGRLASEYGARAPETSWGHLALHGTYSPASIEGFARKAKTRGMRMYRRALRWDLLFALLFSASLISLIDGLLVRSLDASQSAFRWVVWTPIVYLMADVAEDMLLLRLTSPANLTWADQTPTFRPGARILSVTEACTWFKYVFVLLSLGLVLVGGALLATFGPGSQGM